MVFFNPERLTLNPEPPIPEPPNLHFLQRSIDCLLKTRQTSIVQALAVYKYRRRPSHARLPPVNNIPVDQFLDRRIPRIFVQLYHIKTNLFADFLHFGFIDAAVVFKNFIMTLPKFALSVGRQCNGCRPSCKFVAAERKMFDNEIDFTRVFIQHLLEKRLKPRAVRSLIIAKNGNSDRCIGRPLQRQV